MDGRAARSLGGGWRGGKRRGGGSGRLDRERRGWNGRLRWMTFRLLRVRHGRLWRCGGQRRRRESWWSCISRLRFAAAAGFEKIVVHLRRDNFVFAFGQFALGIQPFELGGGGVRGG